MCMCMWWDLIWLSYMMKAVLVWLGGWDNEFLYLQHIGRALMSWQTRTTSNPQTSPQQRPSPFLQLLSAPIRISNPFASYNYNRHPPNSAWFYSDLPPSQFSQPIAELIQPPAHGPRFTPSNYHLPNPRGCWRLPPPRIDFGYAWLSVKPCSLPAVRTREGGGKKLNEIAIEIVGKTTKIEDQELRLDRRQEYLRHPLQEGEKEKSKSNPIEDE